MITNVGSESCWVTPKCWADFSKPKINLRNIKDISCQTYQRGDRTKTNWSQYRLKTETELRHSSSASDIWNREPRSIDNPSVSITCAARYHIRQQYDSLCSLTYYVGSHDSRKLHLSRQGPKILWHAITQTHTQLSHTNTLTHTSLAQSYSPPTDTDRLRCCR